MELRDFSRSPTPAEPGAWRGILRDAAPGCDPSPAIARPGFRMRVMGLAKGGPRRPWAVRRLLTWAGLSLFATILAAQVPALAGILPQVLFAVGSNYVPDATKLSVDAEVACIPPVSGG